MRNRARRGEVIYFTSLLINLNVSVKHINFFFVLFILYAFYMYIYICAVPFFILIKYATHDRITTIHVGHFPPFWFLGTGRKNCHLRPNFSRNVVPQLKSTSSVSLIEAINKNLKQ